MTKRQRALAEQAMALVPLVINAMGRSYPGIRRKIARIDAESAAYVAICKAAQTYDPKQSKVTTYFSSAIRNAVLKEVAKSSRRNAENYSAGAMDAAEAKAAKQGGHALAAALLGLPAQERVLIERRYYGRMSVQEISDETGITAKAVRARLKSAVETLAVLLESHARLQSQQPVRCCDSSGSR